MERVTVYVDGYNLYYGLKRMMAVDSDWKLFYWIDIVKLFDHFMLNNQILQKVYYFTAPPLNIQKSNRQKVLLRANKLINGNRFQFVNGKFFEKELTCAVCGAQYTTPEEKRTDVNISVQMTGDCAQNNTDTLILVSADSDLVPPLYFIKRFHSEKNIKIFFPPKNFSNDLNNFMRAKKGKVIELVNHKRKFLNSVMPDTVTANGVSYTIPQEWKVI